MSKIFIFQCRQPSWCYYGWVSSYNKESVRLPVRMAKVKNKIKCFNSTNHYCQDVMSAPGAPRPLPHLPLFTCPKTLVIKYLDWRNSSNIRIWRLLMFNHFLLHLFSKCQYEIFEPVLVVKWYRQVQQNYLPYLLRQFPSDVLVHLPHYIRCHCRWPRLSKIKQVTSQRSVWVLYLSL